MPDSAELVSWLAFVASLIAIGISAAAAVYTKRQADAAEGNLLPDVELNAKVKGDKGMGRPFDIVVRNHNRQTVHILGFDFRAPDGIRISHVPTPGQPAAPPARQVQLKYDIAVKPLGDHNVPTLFKFVFRAVDDLKVPEQFEIACDVRMRIGNGRRTVKRNCFKTVGK